MRMDMDFKDKSLLEMKKEFCYQGGQLEQISFPIGGIGTGCIGLAGNGRLVDWEIFNRPNKNSYNGYSFFAVKAENDSGVLSAKVLNGDYHAPYTGFGEENNQLGSGVNRETMAGFPHFRKVTFTGRFPKAQIHFQDEEMPLDIKMTAFNPFIPLNDFDSSIPAAIYIFSIKNIGSEALKVSLLANIYNPHRRMSQNTYFDAGSCRGITFSSKYYGKDEPGYGDLSITTDSSATSRQTYLYRGRWFDGMTMLWKDFCTAGGFQDRIYGENQNDDNTNLSFDFRDAGVLASHAALEPGESCGIRYVLSWCFPNAENYWNPGEEKTENGEVIRPKWKNHYWNFYKSSSDAAAYVWSNFGRLYEQTEEFCRTLFDSTLPDYILDAVSANISILKTPTCLRLPDGTLYGFEGCHAHSGSCEGSCTHVWNYDQATAFLFPGLARSMHDIYYRYNQYESGKMLFRMMLPPEKTKILFSKNQGSRKPAADGQMGDIMRVYREWKISGDTHWLKSIWPKVKKALEYAWSPENEYGWDLDCDGVMEGMQHHTLDVEIFGPNAYISGMYQGALLAAYHMGRAVCDPDHEKYLHLFKIGNRVLNEQLFNGEYYIQLIDLENDTRFPIDSEVGQIKNQIGEGCHIDQALAQWHASLYGLGRIFDAGQHRKALGAIFDNNFIELGKYPNPCRVFALNDEKGVVVCTWPRGNAPKIPVPYSGECMYGMEYQYACSLIQEGMVEKGLTVVRACRARFDGKKRNPWNEFESGSNYARSMASYSLLLALSGFQCDMTRGYIGFEPKIHEEGFRCFWSCASGWGQYSQAEGKACLELRFGTLKLRRLGLPPGILSRAAGAEVNGTVAECDVKGGCIEFRRETCLAQGDILTIY